MVKEERERCIAAGGRVVKVGREMRVVGNGLRVNLSRTIGDIQLKRPKKILSSEPEFTARTIDPSRSTMLIMGSDGLFSRLSSKDVSRFVRTYRADPSKGSHAVDVAEALANRAYEKGSWDNISTLVVFFAGS